MGNFPLTRIALNLLLIVALAIQPVAVYAVTVDCSMRCSPSDTLMCPGCGCCEVDQANDQCCCSGTAKVEAQEVAKPSCCSDDKSVDTEVFDAPSSDLKTSSTACKPSDTDNRESGVQSVCLCEQDSQPWSDSSPTRPVSESRTSLAIGYAGPVGADCDGRSSLSTARDGTDVPAIAHFSQIVLCIWRL